MAYWLFKTESDAFSWDEQKAKGAAGQEWDGVRNFQARSNMRAMKKGDRGFFYHTGDEKRVVGIVEVIAEAHPESKDKTGTWECVDLQAVADVPKPVTLAEIKAEPTPEGDGAGEEFAPLGAAGREEEWDAGLQDGRRQRGERCAERMFPISDDNPRAI